MLILLRLPYLFSAHTGVTVMFDRLLIPLDGSSFSESCLPFAGAVPCRRLVLLYVEPPEARQIGEPELSPHAASTYLERHAQVFRSRGVDVETVIDYGDPAERIVDMASEVSLIMMACHARGSGTQLFYGEYADRVARHASAPTILIRGRDHAMAPNGFARIVVPLDGSAAAEEALPIVRQTATSLSLPIHLVRVMPRILADESPTPAPAEIERYFHALLLRLDSGMPVRWDIRYGDPSLELIAHLKPADLLAMTIHGEGGVHRWRLGTVSDRMVRRAPAPVMLIRDGLLSRPTLPITESTGETGASLIDWWTNPLSEGYDAARYGETYHVG
jgi:nucleotide-binding universal stress UspA family protein